MPNNKGGKYIKENKNVIQEIKILDLKTKMDAQDMHK